MGLLSSSVSVTRYIVKGELEKPVLDKVYNGLTQNAIQEINDDHPEKIVGWTSFENPYIPDFEGSSFVIGPYLVFSMRLDRKSIPSKVIQKHYAVEMARQLEKSGRKYLSRNEKKSIKDHVIDVLSLRIPATPNIYDLIWNMEESWLWFFSNLKAANEELETLFSKSFRLSLIRLFPYTTADLISGLSDKDRDLLLQLSPTKFTE
jgi:recombination associated protein RdgC